MRIDELESPGAFLFVPRSRSVNPEVEPEVEPARTDGGDMSAPPPTNRLLLAAVCLLLSRGSCSSRSLPDIPHIAPLFGTKTRYEEVRPGLLLDALSVNASVLRPPAAERCSPVHLSAVIRHGSRYPTAKNIRRIQRLSELLREEASGGPAGRQRDIRGRWENWFTDDMDGERRDLPRNRATSCLHRKRLLIRRI